MTRFYTKQMMKAYVVGSGHIFGHSRQVVIYSHIFHCGTEGLSRKLVPCTPRSRYISRHLINLQNIVFGYIKILNVNSIIKIIIFQMKNFWLYIFAYIYFVNFFVMISIFLFIIPILHLWQIFPFQKYPGEQTHFVLHRSVLPHTWPL